MTARITLLFTFCTVFTSSLAKAAITASFSQFDNTAIVFTLKGDIPVGANIGAGAPNVLFIGVPGDTDWVASQGTDDTTTNMGSPSRLASSSAYNPNDAGDFIQVVYDANFSVGDTVDTMVTLNGNNIIPANVDPNSMIVSAGFDSLAVIPDPTTDVGNAIPEPATYAAVLAMIALGVIGFRHRFKGETRPSS
ncbi:PEP-CTERM sorting domain-containing protein [Rubellicoccus peritrichatus]|uniref:PEP-CTERM sorting domain-containing protein n=1 Tax=Rubellicoccus peritrichatus TaxID=3080537 RepID=A0AAQ3QT51_9BACT|nr:PEP-CTERM sorting domain-containing protein [Puniceicoccus sp. CR14]WOO43313.1 PEP-CTERM sorting domain-containing protein [Puniceicoccus sp. CR14]